MGNLIVSDNDYQSLSGRYKSLGEMMDEAFGEYIKVLTEICQSAITEGQVHQNLALFLETARLLQGRFGEITQAVSVALDEFLVDLDIADDIIYGD